MTDEKKLFFKFACPSVISMLFVAAFYIEDTIFIGFGAGERGLAAVELVWPLIMLIAALGDLAGAGAAVLIAQYRGKGALKDAQRVFGNSIMLVIITAIIFCPVALFSLKSVLIWLGATPELLPLSMEYAAIMIGGSVITMFMDSFNDIIRNDGSPVFAMAMIIGGLASNFLLDWIFIVHFKGGVSAAAYATLLSQLVVVAIGTGYFFSGHTDLKLRLHNMRLHFDDVINILKMGLPVFGTLFAAITTLFMYNSQFLKYGAVEAIAAYTAVSSVLEPGTMLMTGLAAGIQPVAAGMYGSGKYRQQRIIGKMGHQYAFFIGIAVIPLAFVFVKVITALMKLPEDVAALAVHGVYLSSAAFVFSGVIQVAGFYFQSTGKLVYASLLIYGDALVVMPLCLYLLPLWLGLDGLWLALPASRVILFLVLCVIWSGQLANAANIRKYRNTTA